MKKFSKNKDGKFKSHKRIDIGLELAMNHCEPNIGLSIADIATFCGCSRQYIGKIERSALRKIQKIFK